MNLEQETKFLMKKYNITANKNFGQNFLIDENVINKILEASNVNKNDLILEIGPGLGTLTHKLLEKAGKVISIELDKKMLDILHDRFFLYKNFELINNDILKVDINSIINENKKDFSSVKIVANLPYYITTPIILKLLEQRLNISSITVMVQKEIAERFTAKPGEKNCGAITYSIDYYTNANLISNVPKLAFLPAPKVESSIINLEILKEPKIQIQNEELFFKIIKSAFSQKRKTLINCLQNNNLGDKLFLEKMLIDLNFDLQIRGEKLSLIDYKKIYDYISKKEID